MNATIGSRGDLAARLLPAPGPGPLWRLRNLPNWLRGWRVFVARLLAIPTYYGELAIRVIKADGRVVNYGTVSYRVVTSAFAADVVDNLQAAAASFQAYDFHDSGTGSTAEASGDTALVTPVGIARVSGTASEPATNQYRSVATISYTGTAALREHGLFNASSAGTLMDRTVFAAINVENGDSVQFTYTLTVTAGG